MSRPRWQMVIGLTVALVATSCGPNKEVVTSPSLDRSCAVTGGDSSTKITAWIALQGDTKVVEPLLQPFRDRHPRIELSLRNFSGYRQMIDEFAATPVNQRPSMMLVPEFLTRLLADSDQFVPVSACLRARPDQSLDLLPILRSTFSDQDGLLALPFNTSSPLLFYNKAAFRLAGLDAERPPTTVAELFAASLQLVNSRATRNGLVLDSGSSGSGATLIDQWAAQRGSNLVDASNGRAGDPTRLALSADEVKGDLGQLGQLGSRGAVVSIGSNQSASDDLLEVGKGVFGAAMTIHTSTSVAVARSIASQQSGVDLELGIAPLPGPAPGAMVGGGAWWLSAGRPALETQRTFELMSFLAEPKQQAIYSAATGYTPINRGATEAEPLRSSWAKDPLLRVSFDQLASMTPSDANSGSLIGPRDQVRQRMAVFVTSLLSGGDFDEGWKRLESEFALLLSRYNNS